MVDTFCFAVYSCGIYGSDIVQALASHGCVVLRQKGSHVLFRCGKCITTVPVHEEKLSDRLLHTIYFDLKPCLGHNWMNHIVPEFDG